MFGRLKRKEVRVYVYVSTDGEEHEHREDARRASYRCVANRNRRLNELEAGLLDHYRDLEDNLRRDMLEEQRQFLLALAGRSGSQ